MTEITNFDNVEEIFDLMMKDKIFATRLYDMLCKNNDMIWDYIKVGRQFWKYNEKEWKYDLITITYIRSGVAFFITEGKEDLGEDYALAGSFGIGMLYPRVVYVNDIANLYVKYYPEEDDKKEYESIRHMFEIMKPDIPDNNVKIDVDFE